MTSKQLSWAELLALPAATDLRTLGQAFGISEPVARERHRQGEWERLGIRVLRLGAQYRVVSADIWRVLGIDPGQDRAAVTRPEPVQLRGVGSGTTGNAR